VVAIIQLDFHKPRALSGSDRDYLASLAVRGAEALDRTWQYEAALRERAEAEALRARAHHELDERHEIERALRASEARYRTLAARTGRLHGLAAALSGAVTVDAVARAVVEQGRNVLGATNGDLSLLVEAGTQFETLYSDARPSDTGLRFEAEPGLCATEAVRMRSPVFIGSFEEWQERYARSAAIAADGGYASSATLPLHVDAAIVGVLAFHFTAPVNFDEEYQALLISVAQHCAQALDRARLYESAQRARAEAESANHLKDEFVSIVSHELRTPLNSMLGWTAMLRKGMLDPPATERALQSVHENATRQAQFVEELLDLSSITAGRLRMDVVSVELPVLLRGVVETMVPAAAGNRLELDLSPVPPLTLQGDKRRLEQIFLNVLGNAVKFTPTGGRVGIEVRELEGAVEVRVRDSGPGIDPEFLPHMFDRFRQAKGRSAREYGGVGLGLSIAKELVEAHKGRIAAESEGPGHGATFVVTLPTMPAASMATTH
jgi:signal transduction histidine kinase